MASVPYFPRRGGQLSSPISGRAEPPFISGDRSRELPANFPSFRSGRDRLALGVEVDMSEVANALLNVQTVCENAPIKKLELLASAWKECITRRTPESPYFRTHTDAAAIHRSHLFAIPKQELYIGDNVDRSAMHLEYSTLRKERWKLSEAIREAERHAKSGNFRARNAAGYRRAKLNIAKHTADMKALDKKMRVTAPSFGMGGLKASIAVAVRKMPGHGSMTAFSSSYYAYYVEEGFSHVLKPVYKGGKSQTYAMVPLDFTGHYPYLVEMAGDPVKGGATAITGSHQDPDVEDPKYSGGRDTHDVTNATEHGPGAEAGISESGTEGDLKVKFVKRTVQKTEPGVKMFEKGTIEFLPRFIRSFKSELRHDLDRAWGSPLTFDPRLQKGSGQFRDPGGTFGPTLRSMGLDD